MMTRYFGILVVAVSACLVTAPDGALAHVIGHDPDARIHPTWMGESGTASYYGPGFHGRRSADGALYDQMGLTAAHPWLPFGTKVKVTLSGTARTVVVTITDRLHSPRRIVDLSLAAAQQLGIIGRGLAVVTLVPI